MEGRGRGRGVEGRDICMGGGGADVEEREG